MIDANAAEVLICRSKMLFRRELDALKYKRAYV